MLLHLWSWILKCLCEGGWVFHPHMERELLKITEGIWAKWCLSNAPGVKTATLKGYNRNSFKHQRKHCTTTLPSISWLGSYPNSLVTKLSPVSRLLLSKASQCPHENSPRKSLPWPWLCCCGHWCLVRHGLSCIPVTRYAPGLDTCPHCTWKRQRSILMSCLIFAGNSLFSYDWQVLNINIILDDEELDKSSKNQNLFILIGWYNCGPNSKKKKTGSGYKFPMALPPPSPQIHTHFTPLWAATKDTFLLEQRKWI